MSVENVVNHKEEFLNHIYQQLNEMMNIENQSDDKVFAYDKMKLEEITRLDKLCNIDFKRFYHQIYNENGELKDPHKIVRLASLYNYNVAMASYSDYELNLLIETTADIPPYLYPQYDNRDVALFSNREIPQNIIAACPDFESQVNYIKAYIDGCQIVREEVLTR